MLPQSTTKRFWSLVDKSPNEKRCWIWKGYTNVNGYGGFGHSSKLFRAHRIAWELVNGPIPQGVHVLHHCDNPPCVNPDHLFLGTQADNNRDMSRKLRNAARKLSPCEVLEIRDRYKPGEIRLVDLAEEYNVTFGLIAKIIHRVIWKHI